MSVNNGGPAFPNSVHPEHGYGPVASVQEGMTLRDYFAAKVLNGLLSDYTTAENMEGNGDTRFVEWAQIAYEFADAMLKARDK